MERLKLVDAFGDVEEDTLKALSARAAEEYAKDLSEALTETLGEIVGIIGGAAAMLLVRLIWRVSDSVSSKLDALIREPLKTGLRVANESLVNDRLKMTHS
jgi:hypothetical protein